MRKVVVALGLSLTTMGAAVACSSFTTTPASSPDADAAAFEDAAPADADADDDDDAQSRLDAGVDAVVPDDPVAIAAAIDPKRLNACDPWNQNAGTFQRMAGSDRPSICRLCPTSQNDGAFVSLGLPPTIGSYRISLDVRAVDSPVAVTATVDFRFGDASVGEVSGSGSLATGPAWLSISRNLVRSRGAAGVLATLGTDLGGIDRCVDVSNIAIVHTP